MKRYKSTITVFTVLLFVLPIAAYAAATEIQHPRLVVYGQVSKPVYPGRSIFEYKDDQGLSSTLDFERQDKNISILFSNIIFDENFENKSVNLADTTESSAQMTLTNEVLTDANGQEYIYLKITNKTALSTSTYYKGIFTLDVEGRAITSNDYLLFSCKVKGVGGIADSLAYFSVVFLDTGATERMVHLIVQTASGTDAVSAAGSAVSLRDYGNDDVWKTLQFKIGDVLDAAGVSWVPSRLTKIMYQVWMLTDPTTLEATQTTEAWIKHALVSPSEVYIDDPQYENSQLIVNGTSGNFGYSAGDIIQIYGANATKIVGVTLPWMVEVTPEIDKDPDNLRMQYTWEFTMPKSPTDVGDTLTFSNTNMTLYGYKDGDAWDKLYLNGVDKLSSIANLKVPTTTGSNLYWTYALASSLTEGNMYQVVARIEYTADEYDALTEAPLFWSNPFAWIQYKFWSLVIAVAAFLGLGTTWAVKQRRKAQIPKVK